VRKLPITITSLLAAGALAAAFVACSSPDHPAAEHAKALARASTLVPKSPALAELYEQSCKACHAVDGTGAPLVQDRTQWDARWDKGLPALVLSTLAGLNGMPPGGQCFSCTAKDYEALISFMAGRE
jgi:cytochrome c5